jgi:hypothetical protein
MSSYAIRSGGQLVRVSATSGFATTQLKIVTQEEAAWSFAAIGTVIAFEATVLPGAVNGWSPADFERWQVLSFDDPTPPDGEQLVSTDLAEVDGAVVPTGHFAAIPPPAEVTRAQGRLQLTSEGLLDTVDAYVAALDASVAQNVQAKEYWASTGVFRRDNALLNAMWAALGRTSDQLDATFRGAAAFPL